MRHTGPHDPRDDRTRKGNRECVINMELKRGIRVIPSMMGEDVQERPHKVERLARDVGHEKDRTYPLTDKLRSRINALLTRTYKRRHLPRAGALHYFRNLRQRLLEDVGRANVNLGDDDHDRDVEREGDAQVLLAHAHETVVGCDHEEAVVGAAGEEAEDGCAEVLFVAGQVGEGYYLGAASADFFPREFAWGLLSARVHAARRGMETYGRGYPKL